MNYTVQVNLIGVQVVYNATSRYNETVELKLTLSYFIEPNPGFSANVDPQRYQSYGLRFDLRRKGETSTQFRRRVNAAERSRARRRAPRRCRWCRSPARRG